MTRIGINPARGKDSSYRPSRVSVAMITYVPHLSGYFEHRLQVLQMAITSLTTNTPQPYDLFVFDNGSCQPVIDYLQQLRDSGVVDYLLLSKRNIGKIGAFKVLFNAAPGEIIAYSDDDIFFYPGWLEAHLEIMGTFPEVGMVSGIPVRDNAERARNSLMQFIDSNPDGLSVSLDKNIPDEWETDWALSTGRDPQSHIEKIRNEQFITLSYKGVEAFGSASHFQFVSPKQALVEALPDEWSGKLMGKMVELDEAIDQLGYLRLSTVDRYVRHIGNSLSPDVVEDARSLGIQLSADIRSIRNSRHWLLRVPGGGRVLRAIYNRIFQILHSSNFR